MNAVKTRKQQMAERAFRAVTAQQARDKEYDAFAKGFPALVHSAGLCQAVAFALAKGKHALLNDVVKVMSVLGVRNGHELNVKCLEANVVDYLRLSQMAIQAATWIKRYVEALDNPTAFEESRGSS